MPKYIIDADTTSDGKIATPLVKNNNYTELNTTDKTIIGAINEGNGNFNNKQDKVDININDPSHTVVTSLNNNLASISLLSSDIDTINTELTGILGDIQDIKDNPIINPPTNQLALVTLSNAVVVDSNGNLKVTNLGATSTDPQNTVLLKEMNKNIVGLGNVDNTSDINKPISNATQTALNLKANQSDLVITNGNVTTLQTQLNNLTIVQSPFITQHQIAILILGVATSIQKCKMSFKKGNNIYNMGSINTAQVDSQTMTVSGFGTTWRAYLSSSASNTNGTNITATYTNGTKTLQSVDCISMSFPNTTTLLLTFRDNTTTPATISFDISSLS